MTVLRTATLALAAGLAAALLAGTAAPARAGGDASDLMKARNSDDGGDPAKIRELERRLRQAERESAERRSAAAVAPPETAPDAAAVAAAPPPATALTASSVGPARRADAPAPGAGTEEADDGADARPAPVARAGCMYAGSTLIWERRPGTCQ